ncbi:MAG: RecQ family ATP-dependent DNA helicase [Candidatus Omnitrophica bacterium]|nr:ATP-dependent RNA helicase DbpA [bacterium]NUN94914.1 RecQ family ATP-dependent DNA helicase [Candidatus Omnitrophota bacterium]
MNHALSQLRRYWGYSTFLPRQAEAVRAALERRDSLTVLPTGGGKSVCFQVPALCLPGLAVVVSPLIALMKDQVDTLRAKGIPAGQLTSASSIEERKWIARGVREGRLKLLYVAPERLLSKLFLDSLAKFQISFFAVDEAHCISTWGHEFRPEYRDLRLLRERFPDVPIHAFTATASPSVREDVCRELGLRNPVKVIGSFDRPNLLYRCTPRPRGDAHLAAALERFPDQSGIIYCISRRQTERIALVLEDYGFSAKPYHAGMSDEDRKRNQELFLSGEVKTLVATVAFGMGIDKPDIRYVIHASLPKNLEAYQQETGRAGRDGLRSECLLFHSQSDVIAWEKLLGPPSNEVTRKARAGLLRMHAFALAAGCRRKAVLAHFGEIYSRADCGACDRCLRLPPAELRPRQARAGNGKPRLTLSKSREAAFELFRIGLPITAVARQVQRAETTVIGYLEEFIAHSRRTDPGPWISPKEFDRIREAARAVGVQRLRPAFERLGGVVPYEQIRIAYACLRNARSA